MAQSDPHDLSPSAASVPLTERDERSPMRAMNLCLNCLSTGADPVEVGREKGNQRDPYRDTVALCPPCTAALVDGHFDVLHERFNSDRTVRRDQP